MLTVNFPCKVSLWILVWAHFLRVFDVDECVYMFLFYAKMNLYIFVYKDLTSGK